MVTNGCLLRPTATLDKANDVFSNVRFARIDRNYSNLILKLLKEQEELVQKKDYSNLNEIESELEEIQKRTKSTDPNSAFAIAMSAKHKTLTKR